LLVWIKVSRPYVPTNIDKNIGTEPSGASHVLCQIW